MAYNKKLLYVSEAPTWITEAGSFGSFLQSGSPISNINLSAAEFFNDVITYSVTSGSFPTGLSLNSSTGVISGTLTGYSVFVTVDFSITATDSEGESNERDFSLNIIPSYQINYLVVAGGGAGGGYVGGGGGGGGFIEGFYNEVPGNLRSITVGAGSSFVPAAGSGVSDNGSDSSFYIYNAIGGGGGANYADAAGRIGGSGGGSGGMQSNSSITGAPGTSGQGFAAGNSSGVRLSPATQGSGGGGAGGIGGTANGNGDVTAPSGGPGKQSTVCPFGYYYSGGGGGGMYNSNVNSGTGGNGGIGGGGGGGHSANAVGGVGGGSARNSGGNGIASDPGGGGNGGANTGGGGGGAGHYGLSDTSKGGSGIVILRMPTASYSGTTTGSPTVTTDGTDTILTYTGSGTYTS